MEHTVRTEFAAAWDHFRAQLRSDPDHQKDELFKRLLAEKRDELTDDEKSIVIRWCVIFDKPVCLEDFLTQFGPPTRYNFRANGGVYFAPAISYGQNSCLRLLKLHLARQRSAALEIQLGTHEIPGGHYDFFPAFNKQKNFHVLAECFVDCEQIESLVLFDLLKPDVDESNTYHEDILRLVCNGGQLKRLKLHQEEVTHKNEDAAFFFLSEALRCNARLEELCLDEFTFANRLKDARPLESFVDQLSKLKFLKRLSVNAHLWTASQVGCLLSALGKLPCLNELHLERADLGAAAASALAECVDTETLNVLTIHACRMAPSTFETLMSLGIPGLTCTQTLFSDELLDQ